MRAISRIGLWPGAACNKLKRRLRHRVMLAGQQGMTVRHISGPGPGAADLDINGRVVRAAGDVQSDMKPIGPG